MASEYEHPFSAFRGHPLGQALAAVRSQGPQASAAGSPGPHTDKLGQLGIQDVEQLVGIASVPEVRGHLSDFLGMNAGQLDAFVSSVSGVLSKPALEALSTPQEAVFSLGAYEPAEHSRAAAAEMQAPPEMMAKAAAALPPSVNHISMMQPVQQQGQRGTCVSFATTAMHEFFSRVGGVNQKFSEQFLYDETKKIDPQPNGCGTWVAYAIKVLAQLGQCRAVIWAYNPNLPCTHNGVEPPTAKPDAAHFKCSPVMLVNPHDVQGIKSALAGNSNVAFSIPVYNSWYRSPAVYASGRITMRVGTEPGAGGHAMCLVGYQDDQATPGGGYFILRNSWGNGFGTQCPYGIGYGTIPYQYIANDCWEAGFVRPVKPLA